MDCNYAMIYWVPLLSYGMLNKYAKTCFPKPINNFIKKNIIVYLAIYTNDATTINNMAIPGNTVENQKAVC